MLRFTNLLHLCDICCVIIEKKMWLISLNFIVTEPLVRFIFSEAQFNLKYRIFPGDITDVNKSIKKFSFKGYSAQFDHKLNFWIRFLLGIQQPSIPYQSIIANIFSKQHNHETSISCLLHPFLVRPLKIFALLGVLSRNQ